MSAFCFATGKDFIAGPIATMNVVTVMIESKLTGLLVITSTNWAINTFKLTI